MEGSIQHICVMSVYSLLCGTMTPSNIINMCIQKSFNTIGICDINLTTGIIKYLTECKAHKIKPICSVCVKAKYKDIVGYVYVFFINYSGFRSFTYIFNKQMYDDEQIIFDLNTLLHIQECYIVIGNKHSLLHKAVEHNIHNDFIEYVSQLYKNKLFFSYTNIVLSTEVKLKEILYEYHNSINNINMILSYPVIHEDINSSVHAVLRAIDESITLDKIYRHEYNVYFENEYYFRDAHSLNLLYQKEQNTLAYYNTLHFISDIHMTTDVILTNKLQYTHRVDKDKYKCMKLVYMSISKIVFNISDMSTKIQYYCRLLKELFIYEKMNIYNILYIVHDFIAWAMNNDIPIGPGRGSCVGSLLIYCLNITKVDPVYHNLLFERFLNEYRLGTTDIDIDICKEQRNAVINYIKQKYNKKDDIIKVVHIISFTKSMFKNSIKDFARASRIKMNFQELNKVMKNITTEDELTERLNTFISNIEAACASREKHAVLYHLNNVLQYIFLSSSVHDEINNIPSILTDEHMKKIEYICLTIKDKIDGLKRTILYAKQLSSSIRGTGVHAAGILITDFNLLNRLPLYFGFNAQGDKVITTQFDMNMVSAFDIFKFDLLGLDNLTVIHRVSTMLSTNEKYDIVDLIKNTNGIMNNVYKMIQRGYTRGIFQIDKPHVAKIVNKMNVKHFDDLVAINALNRPGTSDLVKTYIKNRKYWDSYTRKNKDSYLFDIVKHTYGVIMFQEQVMEIAIKVAKYDPKDADIFRSIISKKKEHLVDQQREKFYLNCSQQNIPEHEYVQLFGIIEKFAGYAFNKSHAVAYAYIIVESAYLKYLNAIRFLVCFINNKITNKTKVNTLLSDTLLSLDDVVFYVLPNFAYSNTMFEYKVYGKYYYIFVPISFMNNFGIQFVERLNIFKYKYTDNIYELMLHSFIYGKHLKSLYDFGVFRAYINFSYTRVNTILNNKKKLQKKKLLHNIAFKVTNSEIYVDDIYEIKDIKNYIAKEFAHYNFSFIYANICTIIKHTTLQEYRHMLFVVTNTFESTAIISNMYCPYDNAYVNHKFKICSLIIKRAYDDYECITDTIVNTNNINIQIISDLIVIITTTKLKYFQFLQFFKLQNDTYTYVFSKRTIQVSFLIEIIDKTYIRHISEFIEHKLCPA